MAHITLHHGEGFSLRHALTAPFIALGNALVRMGERNSRVQQATYLHSLSDAELEARGMKREDIVHYVFKDVYYV